MTGLHIFRARSQPATKWKDPYANRVVRDKPNALAYCFSCRARRRLKSLVVQAYYDEVRYFCYAGGCAQKERSLRPRGRRRKK